MLWIKNFVAGYVWKTYLPKPPHILEIPCVLINKVYILSLSRYISNILFYVAAVWSIIKMLNVIDKDWWAWSEVNILVIG